MAPGWSRWPEHNEQRLLIHVWPLLPQEVLPCKKDIQADFPPCKWLIRESMTSRRKAFKDFRSSQCPTSRSPFINELKRPLCSLSLRQALLRGSLEESAPSLEKERRESFHYRPFTISSCFCTSSTLSCPLTAPVSRKTLLFDLIQQPGISDSLPTQESPYQPQEGGKSSKRGQSLPRHERQVWLLILQITQQLELLAGSWEVLHCLLLTS